MPNIPNALDEVVSAIGDEARKRAYEVVAGKTDFKSKWLDPLLEVVCESARQAYLQGYDDAGLAAISALANGPPSTEG